MARRWLAISLTALLFVLACNVPMASAAFWSMESYLYLTRFSQGSITDRQSDSMISGDDTDRRIDISRNGFPQCTALSHATMYVEDSPICAHNSQNLHLYLGTNGFMTPDPTSYETKADGSLIGSVYGLSSGAYSVRGEYYVELQRSAYPPSTIYNLDIGCETSDVPVPSMLTGATSDVHGSFDFQVYLHNDPVSTPGGGTSDPENGWISVLLKANINNYGSIMTKGFFGISIVVTDLSIYHYDLVSGLPVLPVRFDNGSADPGDDPIDPDQLFNELSSSSPSNVPIPGAVWLFGTGLIGLIGLRRRAAK